MSRRKEAAAPLKKINKYRGTTVWDIVDMGAFATPDIDNVGVEGSDDEDNYDFDPEVNEASSYDDKSDESSDASDNSRYIEH